MSRRPCEIWFALSITHSAARWEMLNDPYLDAVDTALAPFGTENPRLWHKRGVKFCKLVVFKIVL